MKITPIVCLFIVASFAFPDGMGSPSQSTLRNFFQLFKKSYNKVYSTVEEEEMRFKIFSQTVERVGQSKSEAAGITKFSDLTPEEFKKIYAPRKFDHANFLLKSAAQNQWDGECTSCSRFPEMESFEGENLDWVEKGAVTAVKNQGQCGSCWSFGTTGDIEGSWFLGGNDLVALSEQELVSCDKSDNGCGGGLPSIAFDFIIKNGGLVAEESYPYTSGEGDSGMCMKDKMEGSKAAVISSWNTISSSPEGEEKLQEALVKNGPISIGIDATPMQDYFGGIDNPKCGSGSNDLDHAVLIVGFGEENGQKFWKIKNSWGPDWGEQGYYRIVRGENKCGVAMMAVHSVL